MSGILFKDQDVKTLMMCEIAEPRSAIVAVRDFGGEIADPRSAIAAVRDFLGEIAELRTSIEAVSAF
jgi:hypothetical protein